MTNITESEIMGKDGLSSADPYLGESLSARNMQQWSRTSIGKLTNGQQGTTSVNMPMDRFCGDYDNPVNNTPENIKKNILDFDRREGFQEGLIMASPYPYERPDYNENLQMYQTVDNSKAIKKYGYKQQDNFVGGRSIPVCGITLSYIEIFLVIFLIIVVIYTLLLRSDRDNLFRQNLILHMNKKE